MTSQTIDPPVARPDLSTDSKTKPDIGSVLFAAALWACLVVSCLFLLAVLGAILVEGLSRLDWALISEQPSRLRPETSGVQSAIFGTLWVMLGTIVLALPVGIAGAIYLEEYADNTRWWNRLIELNIQNLVAVPTIICISALPVTPSGLGVRENLFVMTLTVPEIGIASTHALSLSLLAYAGSLFWSLVGGIIYLCSKDRFPNLEAEPKSPR